MSKQIEAMKRWVEVFDGNWHDEPVDSEWADRAHQALAEMRQAIAESAQQERGEPVAKDAEEWGYRLNEASWAAVEAWDPDLMGPLSGGIFNNIKPVIRAAILKYVEGYTPPHKHIQRVSR